MQIVSPRSDVDNALCVTEHMLWAGEIKAASQVLCPVFSIFYLSFSCQQCLATVLNPQDSYRMRLKSPASIFLQSWVSLLVNVRPEICNCGLPPCRPFQSTGCQACILLLFLCLGTNIGCAVRVTGQRTCSLPASLYG